ncbi:MAG: hypothetical protein U0744_21450 [Gemmataceae bacterium]
MKRVAIGLAACVLFTAFGWAQDDTGDADKVQRLGLAFDLAEYGRAEKSPEALITAAKILGDVRLTPSRRRQSRAKVTSRSRWAECSTSPRRLSPDFRAEAKALIDEARALGKKSESVKDYADRVENGMTGERGVVGGVQRIATGLNPGVFAAYPIAYKGGSKGSVTVRTKNGVPLLLSVIDANGNNASFQGTVCRATFNPPRGGGVIMIRVQNIGAAPTIFELVTN